jgi:hypothetical protein
MLAHLSSAAPFPPIRPRSNISICDRHAINASCDCLPVAGRPCGFLNTDERQACLPHAGDRLYRTSTGGRGRIRTFVARKERQIYSLLVLTTHPPVPRELKGRIIPAEKNFYSQIFISQAKTQKGLVSKDTSPFGFPARICSASLPCQSWWSWRRELNPRPSDYKSDALPAELRQRRSNRVRIAERASKLQGAYSISEHVGGQVCGKPLSLCYTLCTPIFRCLYSLA